MRKLLIVVALVVVAVLLRVSFFTVDPTEFVYLTQFGRHVATYDGGDADSDAGLHWRWPWPVQSVQRLDRRLQHFDLPGTELLTHDAEGKTIDKTLTVEAYVCWRIADREAVDRFIRRLGTPDQARAILGQRLNSHLGAVIGRMRMDDLVSIEAGRVDLKMKELRNELLSNLKEQARTEYGVELVDVRLRRFNHPAAVRGDIFERIKSERDKKVAQYQSEGNRLARNIRSKADQQARDLLAEARFEEERLKGQADTDAIRIRNQAHSEDPEFYVFLKKLEKLQSILGDNKTVLLLSSHREIFDLLFSPPRPNGPAMPPGPRVTGKPPANGTSPGTVKPGPTKGGGE
jgi:membrane protease subunit HflC